MIVLYINVRWCFMQLAEHLLLLTGTFFFFTAESTESWQTFHGKVWTSNWVGGLLLYL